MTSLPQDIIARSSRSLVMLGLATLAACTSMDPAPQTLPFSPVHTRPAGDLSAGRRCMDNHLLDYGPHDLSVVVEDLADPTQRIGAGSREMLVAALSDMTLRSRAIRLLPSAANPGFAPGATAQAPDSGAGVAQLMLRGSISLRGSDMPQAADAKAPAPATSVLGLDLALLSTRDMSFVPGAASHNTAALFERGAGLEGRAELRKFGVSYSLPSGADDGRLPALRALVDVAAIEVFGRLAKLPYWTCLGATIADPKIAAEVQDWYDAMAAHPAEIVGYFQRQLQLRRLYTGPVDGVVNAAFKDAVARYREGLGLSREAKLSLDFFQAYLSADHRSLATRLAPAATAAAAPIAADAPLALRIAAAGEAQRFGRGEAVQLTVQPNRDAHVYCFYRDENRKITRFFPNRFQRDSRVPASAGLQLPGAMRFEIVMNARGAPEAVTCFATDRDVLAQLPTNVGADDFAPLAVTNLDQVRNAFLKVAGGALGQDSFQIRAR